MMVRLIQTQGLGHFDRTEDKSVDGWVFDQRREPEYVPPDHPRNRKGYSGPSLTTELTSEPVSNGGFDLEELRDF